MAGDRPRQQRVKFLTLNVDFSSKNRDPLGYKRPAQTGVKYGYPLPLKALFYRYWLV